MGCEQSGTKKTTFVGGIRKIRKKGERIIPVLSDSTEVFENVELKDETMSSHDTEKIQNIISSHFFFSGLSECDRNEIIQEMKIF